MGNTYIQENKAIPATPGVSRTELKKYEGFDKGCNSPGRAVTGWQGCNSPGWLYVYIYIYI